MGLAAIFGGITAIAKAIPLVKKMIDGFIDFYVQSSINRIKRHEATDKQKRKALMRAISNAKDNDERKALSIVLNDVMSNAK